MFPVITKEPTVVVSLIEKYSKSQVSYSVIEENGKRGQIFMEKDGTVHTDISQEAAESLYYIKYMFRPTGYINARTGAELYISYRSSNSDWSGNYVGCLDDLYRSVTASSPDAVAAPDFFYDPNFRLNLESKEPVEDTPERTTKDSLLFETSVWEALGDTDRFYGEISMLRNYLRCVLARAKHLSCKGVVAGYDIVAPDVALINTGLKDKYGCWIIIKDAAFSQPASKFQALSVHPREVDIPPIQILNPQEITFDASLEFDTKNQMGLRHIDKDRRHRLPVSFRDIPTQRLKNLWDTSLEDARDRATHDVGFLAPVCLRGNQTVGFLCPLREENHKILGAILIVNDNGKYVPSTIVDKDTAFHDAGTVSSNVTSWIKEEWVS